MVTAVDTNILLDILIPDAKYCISSKGLLDEACQKGALIICEVVYAELASQFESQKDLDEFLKETGIRLQNSNPGALYRASAVWKNYLRSRGEKFVCPQCGTEQRVKCKKCGHIWSNRQHILSDFLICGHALEQAEALLTRDRGYYRTYFRELQLYSSK